MSYYQSIENLGARRLLVTIALLPTLLFTAYNGALDANTACTAGNCQFIKSDAALAGENRWRARAGNAVGFSQWSDWGTFFVQ